MSDDAPDLAAQGAGAPLLQGQVAVITGGAQGIGFAIAQAFADAGADLVLSDLGCDRDGHGADPQVVEDAAALLRKAGANVVTHAGDVGDPEHVHDLFARAEKECGPPTLLVNNAGIISDKSLFSLDINDWDRVIRTHLRGTFLCTQAMANIAKRTRLASSIINMTSTSGMLGNLGQINESSAKAGIYGLTRTASIELQRYQVRVNAIAAIAKTRLTHDLPMFEKVMGTMDPQHVAPVALFLASSLSEDLSGIVLSVAGGRICTFELTESQGRIKEADGGVWTPAEIAENYDSLARR